jgi:uncharacterized YigZ family protein
MDQYLTIKTITKPLEIAVKGSKFISRAYPVTDRSEAEKQYQNIKKQYHNASHNCYAYRIDETEFRYSDGGEPSGTAGRPILKAIELHNLYGILIVVTRYFGGIKLGTGGLNRAYGEAALMALEEAEIVTRILYVTTALQTTYENQQIVNKFINKFEGNVVHTDYTDKINVTARIPKSKFGYFQTEIKNLIQRNIISIAS